MPVPYIISVVRQQSSLFCVVQDISKCCHHGASDTVVVEKTFLTVIVLAYLSDE